MKIERGMRLILGKDNNGGMLFVVNGNEATPVSAFLTAEVIEGYKKDFLAGEVNPMGMSYWWAEPIENFPETEIIAVKED